MMKLLFMRTQNQPCCIVPPLSSSLHLLLPGIQSDLDRQLVEEQWEMLSEMMQEKAAFVFGKQGCLTDTELQTVLKVRGCMQQCSWNYICTKPVKSHSDE